MHGKSYAQCDGLKFEIEIIHTTSNLNNGIIEVTVIKSNSKVRVFLYGDLKSKNRLDVKPSELTQLAAGTYLLVIRDDKCNKIKRDIVIE